MSKVIEKRPSDEVIANYAKKRKDLLTKLLGEYTKTEEPNYISNNPRKITPPNPNTGKGTNDEVDGLSDTDVDFLNTSPKSPTITNDKDEELNMILHTVMV